MLESKAQGTLVGAAVGDALGMPKEFGWVPGPVSGLVKGRLPAGSFTDDSEMMIALSESLIARQGLDPEDLGQRFVGWMKAGPSDIGNTTSRMLSALGSGEHWEKVAERELSQNPNNAANGSLMRCFPVALADHDDLDACVRDSVLQSRITHPHRDCLGVCIVANAFIWHALHGADKVEAFEQALALIADNTSLHSTLKQGMAPGRIPPGGGGAVVTMHAALWAVLNKDSYADAVLTVVNNCGDPDTVGCVTGALAGALWGYDAIPQDWREGLLGEWPINSSSYVNQGYFVKLAEELLGIKGGAVQVGDQADNE